jgi:hypothetical protein
LLQIIRRANENVQGRSRDVTLPGLFLVEDLGFVEGSVAVDNGSVIVVSLSRGEILRVHPDGSHDVVLKPGGSPRDCPEIGGSAASARCRPELGYLLIPAGAGGWLVGAKSG